MSAHFSFIDEPKVIRLLYFIDSRRSLTSNTNRSEIKSSLVYSVSSLIVVYLTQCTCHLPTIHLRISYLGVINALMNTLTQANSL